jgi:hypothetical protein
VDVIFVYWNLRKDLVDFWSWAKHVVVAVEEEGNGFVKVKHDEVVGERINVSCFGSIFVRESFDKFRLTKSPR